jgi:uncharacterized protein YbgA (DUF1722 family)/uncharacterized protein YbbK (DUF523 family)
VIRVGVSSCLLGRPVRYDGGHKRDDFIVDILGPHVEFVPVCPEVELGLGTPRETLRLVRHPGELRLVMANGDDYTDAMRRYARKRAEALARDRLDGYILKKDSPSCGMERVKVYPPSPGFGETSPPSPGSSETSPGGRRKTHHPPERTGRGLFAAALIERLPILPVEEEGRLNDARLRENFIERVFAHRRLRELFTGRWTMGDLVRFHTAHKLTVLAHSPVAYRSLGQLVAGGKAMARADLRARYETAFMAALTVIATPKKHANVLQHMVGYLREGIDTASRDELLQAVDDHRAGLVPLVVPITLMRHHVRRLGVDYLLGQTYLDPHPKELMLRNHV